MAEDAPERRHGGGVPKTRADDARGAPAGGGTVYPAHGGRIGNPPFEPTAEQRKQVRDYAKVFPMQRERSIALLMGFSYDTLKRYFQDDIEMGRAELIAAVGSQMVNRAIDATKVDLAKGDLDAQKFLLARIGGWSTKTEVSGPGGGPIPVREEELDLSRFTDEELETYGQLAAKAARSQDGNPTS